MSRKPRIRIPVHVAVYTIAFAPGAAYAYYWYKNAPTEEEFEKELRKNYSHNIENSKGKHEQMSTFLQGMKDPNADQQRQMAQVLLGGKGQQNKRATYDEKLYGTEEGAKLQEEAMKKAAAKKGKRRKKKKKSKNGDADGKASDAVEKIDVEESSHARVKQSVAAVAVVGALAAGASFFLGGKRQ